MGELVVSAREGDELVAVGLGSCVGVAVVDRRAGVAGLAHVVLPDSAGTAGSAGKFADLAVPELVARVEDLGGLRRRMQAVLIGGARMFALGPRMDVGARNAEAVRTELGRAHVRIHAQAIGGNRGRTARVVLGAEITSQLAGGERTSLLSLRTRAGSAMSMPTLVPHPRT